MPRRSAAAARAASRAPPRARLAGAGTRSSSGPEGAQAAFAQLVGKQWARFETRGVLGIRGDAERPFEAPHIRQIRELARSFQAGEKDRELGAILVEVAAARRMVLDEFAGNVLEELALDEPLHRR